MAEVLMPELGENITEGTVTQWFKAVGEVATAGEALFEVSTDKVDAEVPSPLSGTVTEIRASVGETVAIGAVVAVVDTGTSAPTGTAPSSAEPAPAVLEPAAATPVVAPAAATPVVAPAAQVAVPTPAAAPKTIRSRPRRRRASSRLTAASSSSGFGRSASVTWPPVRPEGDRRAPDSIPAR